MMGTTVSETDGYRPCCSKEVVHPCASCDNNEGSNKVGDLMGSKIIYKPKNWFMLWPKSENVDVVYG